MIVWLCSGVVVCLCGCDGRVHAQEESTKKEKKKGAKAKEAVLDAKAASAVKVDSAAAAKVDAAELMHFQ